MIIEDNPDDYEALSRGFKHAGIQRSRFWYRSAERALTYLKHQEPHKDNSTDTQPCLIILDLNLPGMDGRRFLSLVKKTPASCVPVVIFTTSTQEKDIRLVYQLGACSFIQKPVEFEKLIQVCQRIQDYWFDTVLLPQDLT